MKIIIVFIAVIIKNVFSEDNGAEVLSVSVDGLLMENSKITSSATCGLDGPEKYCRLVDERASQAQLNTEGHVLCDICDDRNETKRHSIEFAKSDDDNLWWQSPSMAQGVKYQNVNVTIDLKQVYQIVYILLKMGNSPRPGNWVLERSLDGITYTPWIFFAETPYSCYNLFQRQYPSLKLTTSDKPDTLDDDEIFCTTYYSQPKSLNSGEIIISMINGRKSIMNYENLIAKSIPQKLINFLSARFIRFRFLKHLTLAADLMTFGGYLEKSIYNRYFYSLRNIEIGGKCICNNHADKCDKMIEKGITISRCNCKHNTCGNNCEKCCPLFNQKPWKPAVSCEECNCNRKSNECLFNQTIATLQLSTNKMGQMDGGGVCTNCQENTEGINCEKCKKRFFRPYDVLATERNPCVECSCYGLGTIGDCISNGEEIDNQKPGDCICKTGYAGAKCDSCDIGYEKYPNGECLPCPCSIIGSVTSSLYKCKPPCNCKINVEVNSECKICKNGFINLDPKNPEGCQPCYCFGLTNQCSSLSAQNIQINDLNDWKISTIVTDKKVVPKMTSLKFLMVENTYLDKLLNHPSVYYWIAPKIFLGNWLTSFGTILRYVVNIELISTNEGSQIDSPDVIIKCGSVRLFHSVSREDRRLQRKVLIYLKPEYWKTGQLHPVKEASLDEFLSCLVNVDSLLIKAKYYINQKSIGLLNVTLSRGEPHLAINEMPHIEKCNCPPGFSGLSCESCKPGYRRINNIRFQGQCDLCSCNNHSTLCDAFTGECKNCLHNTKGPHCDECKTGFYGYPKSKEPDSCKRCTCPLFDYQMTDQCSTYSQKMYICHECSHNTTGVKCDRCIDGFYGNPLKKIPCKKCKCNDNQESCSPITGDCKCSFNTMGVECEVCKYGYYGDALSRKCKKCNCDSIGSSSEHCNKLDGQCSCRANFVNRQCDSCAPGLYLKNGNCVSCVCDLLGRISSARFCNATTGQCYCRNGVNGEQCSQCMPGYYDYPNCIKCQCSPHALSSECDKNDGSCRCGSNVADKNCDKCRDLHYWVNASHCSACNCGMGSTNQACDMSTGNCNCSRNVILRDCSKCQTGYFGLSSDGCKKCPVCNDGRVCNNEGICVCPSNTVGRFCEKCSEQSWNYSVTVGCQPCSCFSGGSISATCNSLTGECFCLTGFKGLKCLECNNGYYGFPQCESCNCSPNGTVASELLNCHRTTGYCTCKHNVMGPRCNHCKTRTFRAVGSQGGECLTCFCFGVSERCHPLQNYSIIEDTKHEYIIFNDKEAFKVGEDNSVILLNLSLPNKFGWPLSMFRPLYVDIIQLLPSNDLTLFYRSTLLIMKISCLESKCGKENSIQHEVIMKSYNELLELKYIVNYSLGNVENLNIELSEQSLNGRWMISKYKDNSLNKVIVVNDSTIENGHLPRDIFMMALSNVTSFKVKLYSGKVNPPLVKLKILTFAAVETDLKIGKPVTAVEKCECNSISGGNHCQNPRSGYYKHIINITIDFHMESRSSNQIKVSLLKCNCNGHSTKCDGNTGSCFDCSNNTNGNHCQLCIDGYYGDPKNNGLCEKCHCPTKEYNFGKTCVNIPSTGEFKCKCQIGYSGVRCERCEDGFYGNPLIGITCKPCNCNTEGSHSIVCNEDGACFCAAGVRGIKCDQCDDNHVVEKKTCKNCYSGCTLQLFNRLDNFSNSLANFKHKTFQSNVNLEIQKMNASVQNLSNYLTTFHDFNRIKDEIYNVSIRYQIMNKTITEKYAEAENMKQKYKEALEKLLAIFKDINETMSGDVQRSSSGDVIQNSTKILYRIQSLITKMPNIKEAELFLAEVLKYVDDLNKMIKLTQNILQSDQLIKLGQAVNKTRMANDINMDNNEYLKVLQIKFGSYNILLASIAKKLNDFEILLSEIKLQKTNIENKYKELEKIADHSQQILNKNALLFDQIQSKIDNITNNASSSKRLIIPDLMKRHFEEQLNTSTQLIKNLTKDFNFVHNAEQAKEAYSNISRDILAVDQEINDTRQQLSSSKPDLLIENMKNALNKSYFFSVPLEIRKNDLTQEHKDFIDQLEKLNATQIKLKMMNKKLANEQPVPKYNFEILENKLSKIKAKQSNTQFLIDSINHTLSTFPISKSINNGEKNFEKLIDDVTNQYNETLKESLDIEGKIKKIRNSIKDLRERLARAKIIADLTHGAASRSIEPIRLVEQCVRRYVTYYLPLTNAFSLEFHMKPQFVSQPSLVLFGYDNSGHYQNAFAFTIEANDRYKFWCDYGHSLETIEMHKKLSIESYAIVQIKWQLGKWKMIISSLVDNEGVYNETYSKSDENILYSIRTGPKTNIFIGGFPSSKLLENITLDGKLISFLKENYRNNFFKGCLFGVSLMNHKFGLQDIEAVETECKKTIDIHKVLKGDFHCKTNMEDIGKLQPIKRKTKRNTEADFDIHFTGNGYAMINTSQIKEGNCKTKLNKVLSISTITKHSLHSEIFQLIAVFTNNMKDIGFVLGYQREKYYFGYWSGNIEKELIPLMTSSGNFDWNIFKSSIGTLPEKLFGIEDICDPNSLIFLADVPIFETKLIEKLKKLKVPNFGFTGKMKLMVNQKNEFQVLATRFINVIFIHNENVFNPKFHSMFISSDVNQAIDINLPDEFSLINNGFSFSVDFMGIPINRSLLLMSFISIQTNISIEITPSLQFALIINKHRLEKNIPRTNIITEDWGPHYIVVLLKSLDSSIMAHIIVDNKHINAEEIRDVANYNKGRVMIGSTLNPQHSYYFYDLFLGFNFIDFNHIGKLPPGVFLKLRVTHLQPEEIQFKKTDFNYPTILPEDYPTNSAWFDGAPNSHSNLKNEILNTYGELTDNEISFMIRSVSLHPETLISFYLNSNEIFNIATLNGHLILVNSERNYTFSLAIPLIDDEWHTIRIKTDLKSQKPGIVIYQDMHSFEFLFPTFGFSSIDLIKIGGNADPMSKFYYNMKKYQLKPFTGCIDAFKINNKFVSFKKGSNLKQCPKVLEFLRNGGQILNSYTDVSNPDTLIKLKLEKYSIVKKLNAHVLKFKLKYTGFEEGNILIIGEDPKYCSLTITKNEMHLNHFDFKRKEITPTEILKIDREKWIIVEFGLIHTEFVTFCKMIVDEAAVSVQLIGEQGFSAQFQKPDFYFGSHPNLSASRKYTLTKSSKNFVGCISDLEFTINGELIPCAFEKSDYIMADKCSINKQIYKHVI